MPNLFSYQRMKLLFSHTKSKYKKRWPLKWKQKYCPSSCSTSVNSISTCRSSPSMLSICPINQFKTQCCGNETKFFSSLHSLYDTFDEQPPSWLFVSDAISGAYGAQVNLDLDLIRRLSSDKYLDAMIINIQQRKIQFDLNSLVSDFKEMTALTEECQRLNTRKKELLKRVKALKEENCNDKSSLDEVLDEMRECKTSMKDALNNFWSVEEKVMWKTLRLPNDLHPALLSNESVIMDERSGWLCQTDGSHYMNHVDIGKKFDLIKFSNVGPRAYYLKGELAKVDKRLSDMACEFFLRHNYRLLSGPQFFKTPIMESCGRDVSDTLEVLTLKHISRDIEPMRHLAGVSPMTFAAYMAKLCVGDASLPLRMFSIGPHYQTGNSVANGLGLYGAVQRSCLAMFCCTSQTDLDNQYQEMVDIMWHFVSSFGFSVRLVQCCASKLRREERRRCGVEIWAPSLKQFIPIASVSDLGDFVSRRQMSVHNHNHGDIRHTKLLHMVSGTAIDLTTLLAVLLEHSCVDEDKFSLIDLPVLSRERKMTQ